MGRGKPEHKFLNNILPVVSAFCSHTQHLSCWEGTALPGWLLAGEGPGAEPPGRRFRLLPAESHALG